MELKEAVALQEKALLQSLQESIRIRSVEEPPEENAPYGPGVARCLAHALQTAEALGFRTTNLDNHMGWCEYGEGEEMIAVLGHLDVVPEGDGWTFDPFAGTIADGKVFGRGTMDDKGPTLAALYAMAALRDSGLPLRRRIRILFGTNEETGSNDMKYYKAHGGEIPVMGITPDGEYPVINGEKGLINSAFTARFAQEGPVRLLRIAGGDAHNVVPAFAWAEIACPGELAAELAAKSGEKLRYIPTEGGVRVEADGVGAHGGTPELGENAIGRLAMALKELPFCQSVKKPLAFLADKIGMESDGARLGIALSDELSGRLTFNLGTIEGGEDGFTVKINYRYPVTCRYEDCAPAVLAAFNEGGFALESESHKQALYLPEEHELIQTLLRVYHEETGLPARPKCIGGGTYAKTIPNTVAFGPIFPGDEVREHKPDEFIEIDKLMKNTQILAQALYQLAK